ncbi:MAG: PD40 domain-containing protein [Bacteroidetes bacterium]|nr:PD40 domain-containing protein [Bacteroidota bacterium]
MKQWFILIGLFVFLVVNKGTAQNSVFGKNKVQYKYFHWQYIQSDHFDIYFSQDGYEIAQFTASAAENAYESIKNLLRYEINNRISFVVYNSHNEFQQTNVISQFLEEGIGGVTELFKNRIVVPFEGDYAQFRHVIHHELVHGVINDMFYGGTIQSLISNKAPVQIPLWMNEGICEYSSLKWDNNSDMFIRDATVHNYLPPISHLNGYFAYRGGQSVWFYIANKYGEHKISEIFHEIKRARSVEKGFNSALGMPIKELSERWQKEQKVYYWPDVAKREEPADFSYKRLTNHVDDDNFYNTSPAISPQGDKIAFISDRGDYFDVFLMSALDGEILGKIVSGQKTNDFEELHLLTPGITWSPDGKKIALAVKSGGHDAIITVDVESGSREKFEFDLDGIFSVHWSNDSSTLVFVGVKIPQSDIYLYNMETKELKDLTNDIFSDMDPVFSNDGKTVFFVSDRGDMISPSLVPEDFRIWDYESGQTDIYSLDISTGVIHRITTQPNGSKSSPVPSPDGKRILYISDINGINNLYNQCLETGEFYPVTNSISGIYQLSLSRDGSKLVFSSMNEAGFDIYLMLRPLERKLNVTSLEPTEYYKIKYNLPRDERPRELLSYSPESDTIAVHDDVIVVADTVGIETAYEPEAKPDFSGYIFSTASNDDTTNVPPPISKEVIADNLDSEGNYIPRRYKLNFSPDLVYGAAGYNTLYGLGGGAIIAFSDMLGDHQIVFQTNLMIDLKNSDYGISYYYLPGRIDWGFQAFHNAKFLLLDNDFYYFSVLYRFRTWGAGLTASYPIDRFNRIDGSLMWLNLSRENLDDPYEPKQSRSLALPLLSYVWDNSLWQGAWFGPNNGSRFNFTFYGTPKLGGEGLDIQTFTADYRSYNRLAKEFILAYRISGGLSTGGNKQNFFIGGTEGWFNWDYTYNDIPIKNVEDFAFLTPVLPLRGFNYAQQVGTHFAVANLEFRFPLLKYLIFGAVPIGFANILGTAFIDVGSAWTDSKSWKMWAVDPSGETVLGDLLVGTGLGTRLFIFGFPLRFDVAWRYKYSGFSEPYYYFSLGADF